MNSKTSNGEQAPDEAFGGVSVGVALLPQRSVAT